MGEARRRKRAVGNTYKVKNNEIKDLYIKVLGWITSSKTSFTKR